MSIRNASRRRTIRTTVALSADLLAFVDGEIAEGRAESRNELLNEALERELRRRRSEEIDRQILAASSDPALLAMEQEVMKDFEAADRDEWLKLDEDCGPYPCE